MSIRAFFTRPLGGVELEAALSMQEILWSIPLLTYPEAVWNIRSFQSLYGDMPHWVFGLPWATSGSLTIIGLILFYYCNKRSKLFRVCGAVLSLVLWGWLFAKSLMSVGFDASFLGIYLVNTVASFRLLVSVSRPWSTPPWAIG